MVKSRVIMRDVTWSQWRMWQWLPHVCVRAMTQHPQLFVLIFLLVVAFISRYGNSAFSSKPVILPPMPPRRFFPFDSLVVEFPFGSISSLLDFVRDDEIIFVMYYAPWCTRSMAVRWEFHKAASFMKDQVKFVAVNCWWNEGECHRKYKFISHPMLYVYHTNLDGFQYTGIPTADYFVHFLENLIYPITHLFDEKGIKKFVSLHDNAVIGYFDFNSSPQPPGYQQFYYASMRAIERSPVQILKFGVLTSPYHTDILNMPPKSSSAVLVKHGSIILNYPEVDNFTSSELVKWAFQEQQQPLVQILNPSGTKSLQLSNEIAKGPTLIMFSNHYPLFHVNHNYHMLREIALEYTKCEMDEISNENLLYSLTHRLSSMKKLQELTKCSKEQQREGFPSHAKRVASQKAEQQLPKSLPFTYLVSSKYFPASSSLLVCQCCVSVLQKHLLEGHLYRNVCEVCYNSVKSARSCHLPCNCPKGSTYKFNEDRIYSTLQNKCLQFSPNYIPTQYKSVCCHKMHKLTTNSSKPFSSSSFSFPVPPTPSSSSDSSNVSYSSKTANKTPSSKDPSNSSVDNTLQDPFIIQVLKNRTQQLCDHYNLQFVQGVPIDTNFNVLSLTLVKNFSGLSCRTNKTVHFYAMDLTNHWMFADRFGLNSTKLLEIDQPAVVMVDMADEKNYVLKKPFSKTSVAEFVLNYTEGHLEREMLTAPVDRAGSLNCSLNPEDCDHQPPPDPLAESEHKYLYITEVTAHTFHKIVLNTSKDVLLLYYAPWCGFCASFAHIYLSLAKYFRAATSLLFARINGDTEDLPWEYTADTYPTLLFFPSGRKEDSVVYSEDLPKTLTNLIRFVLHHATHTVSLWTDSSQQCTAHCIKTNRQNALIRITVLSREIKRLELRLTHLENSVVKRKLLDSAGKQLPASVQIIGAMVTRAHWQKLVERKKRQRLVCKKLVRFLKRKDSFLNKEDLVNFMKTNNLLLNHFPSL
ncbi:domain-containing 11-like [Octopus vulgaris]|uniref:Domain-containing 11-like n=2 Tax=Octopus vulgaris TaxID=6645 RepID=A0AA36F0E5_OCTVU|nr:domain-containing 11-like [Octopus vulgaris]